MQADPVQSVIDAFRRGELVVVTDDDDRENEGDLFIAANHCSPEMMAFIIRHTSGIVCAPMAAEIARKFRLDPMVMENEALQRTAFTVSVDFKHGLTTGISADERTATVRALANDNAGPDDFARPGHVFPLIARAGGVLIRSGHTEACVDLCRLAGLPEVGVLAELVNDDGTVMRGQQVAEFAATHSLAMISVADLIAHRQRSERLVERVGSFDVTTRFGTAQAVTYTTPFDPMQHMALVFGAVGDGEDITVRLQLEDVASDVFGQGRQIEHILERVSDSQCGIVVYLREGAVGVADSATRTRDNLPDDEDHDTARERETEWREIGLGAQILLDLGVRSIRLLASRERRYVGLGGFGIKINKTEIFDA